MRRNDINSKFILHLSKSTFINIYVLVAHKTQDNNEPRKDSESDKIR